MLKHMHFILIALFFLASCTPTIKTPKGFAPINEPDPYLYKAMSADDVAIALQRRDNDPKGDLEFWTKIISEKLPYAKGYKLKGTEPFKTSDGLKGTLMTFTVPGSDGKSYTYMLVVIPKGDDLWLLEAGGPSDKVTKHHDAIIAAFKSFEP